MRAGEQHRSMAGGAAHRIDGCADGSLAVRAGDQGATKPDLRIAQRQRTSARVRSSPGMIPRQATESSAATARAYVAAVTPSARPRSSPHPAPDVAPAGGGPEPGSPPGDGVFDLLDREVAEEAARWCASTACNSWYSRGPEASTIAARPPSALMTSRKTRPWLSSRVDLGVIVIAPSAGSQSRDAVEPGTLRIGGRLDGSVDEELTGQREHRGLELRVVEKIGAVEGDAADVHAVVAGEGDHEWARVGFARLLLTPANP